MFIKATNVVGVSTNSTILVIWAAVVPNAPINLIRVAGSNTLTSIDLSWSSSYNGGSAITGYQIWWNQGGSG